MSPIRSLAAVALAAASTLVMVQTAAAQGAAAQPPRTVAELQQIYLDCDREAARRLLDTSAAAYCSIAAEELRLRGFGGSFDRLLAWWKTARHQAQASNDPTAPGPAVGRGP